MHPTSSAPRSRDTLSATSAGPTDDHERCDVLQGCGLDLNNELSRHLSDRPRSTFGPPSTADHLETLISISRITRLYDAGGLVLAKHASW